MEPLRPAQGLAAPVQNSNPAETGKVGAVSPQSIGLQAAPPLGYTQAEFVVVVVAILLLILWSSLGSMPQSLAGALMVGLSLGFAALRNIARADHNSHFASVLDTLLDAQQALAAGGPPLPGDSLLPITNERGNAQGSASAPAATGAAGAEAGKGVPFPGQSGSAGVRLLACLTLGLLVGCAAIVKFQNNPAVQAAETAGISIGLDLATKSPAFSFVAPIAVNGLTALVNGANPTAVTGSNVAADVQTITTAVTDAIPNSAGTTAASGIAQAYTTAMASGSVPQNATGANAVLAAIAHGLTLGAKPSVPDAVPLTIRDTIERRRWRVELQRGDLSRDEFASLVRGQKDIDENMLLKRSLGRAWAPAHVLRAPLPPDWDPVWFQFERPSSALRFRNRLPDLRDDERPAAPVMFVVR